MIFSSSPERLPVRTLPSEATARKKKVEAIRGPPRMGWISTRRRRDAEQDAEHTTRKQAEFYAAILRVFLRASASPRQFLGRSSELLRHSHDLFHGGHARPDHAPAILTKIAHSVSARG